MSEQTSRAGRVALVTGSARNIGRAIALALAADGVDVVINARTSLDEASEVADAVRAMGQRAAVIGADISDPHDAARLVAQSVEEMGQLDHVVLNAAIRRQGPIESISIEEWRTVIGVALDGAFFVSQAAVPHLRQSGQGRLVFLGGSPSHVGTLGRPHVCAAKMGAVGLMRALATELGPDGITANTVAPGHIDTTRGAAAGVTAAAGQSRPVARLGAVEEIAETVRFVCSSSAAYMTGQTLHVNGGMYYG